MQRPTPPDQVGPSENFRLLQELQFSQIELQSQNEALRLLQIESETAARQYAELYDLAPVGYSTLDASGTITQINRHGATLLDQERKSLIGHCLADYVDQADRPVLRQFLTQMLTGQSANACDIGLHRKDGSPRTLELSASTRHADSACLTVLIDVTEQRDQQRRLLQTHTLLNKLADNVPGMICQLQRLPNGRVSMPYASAGIQTIYELTAEQVHDDARLVCARHHPDDAPALGVALDESARSMQPWHHEYRVRLPIQGERWLRGHARPQSLPDGATLWHGTINDITEQKLTEQTVHFLASSGGALGSEGFFRPLASFLVDVLSADYICIDRLSGDQFHAQTLAVFCDGRFEDNLTYGLRDTPCGEVIGRQVCVFPSGVCQRFPNDKALQDLQADGYIGVTLWSSSGLPIGLIAVISRRPLADATLAESILRLVAVRAADELERQTVQEALI
ncbi:MAG: PAS domain-containing protein, partial [Rhodoferax sp.]